MLFKHFVKEYLNSVVKSSTFTGKSLSVHIGNVAADADSIISSICSSFHDYKSVPNGVEYIPLCCIRHDDICMKREVDLLLNRVDLTLVELPNLDTVSQLPLSTASSVSLTLLDHNELNSAIENFIPIYSVQEIIDHHVDVGKYPYCKKRNIAFDSKASKPGVGSACTLIFEKFMNSFGTVEKDVATLLLGVILLDTIDMDPKAGKGTERDERAIEELQKITGISRTELFNELQNVKMDLGFWRSMSARDCFRLDYKDFHVSGRSFGIAAVLMPASELISSKTDLLSSCRQYLFDRAAELDCFLVMSLVSEPILSRELFIVAKSLSSLQSMVIYLKDTDIQLVPLAVDSSLTDQFLQQSMFVALFQQRNVKASRKQLAPLLSDYFGKSVESC